MPDTDNGLSLREALESAMESSEAAETTAPEVTSDAAPVEAEALPAEETVETKPSTSAADKARDDKGRFAPKGAGAKPAAASAVEPHAAAGSPPTQHPAAALQPPAAAAPVQPATQPAKAPASWTPMAREKWAALPPEVQAEVARRERETAIALQESSKHRRVAEEFQAAVGPFEAMIRAEGGSPAAAVRDLLQTAAALRTAPPVHKAQLVANIVRTFGVPIEALDAALAGQPVPQGTGHAAPVDASAIAQQVQQQVLQQFQTQQRQVLVQKAQGQVSEFLAKAEWGEDLREDIADIIEVAARRGRRLTLEQAYDKAAREHPEISKVVAQREAAKAATNARASTQAARAAATSVRSRPAGAPSGAPQPTSLRETIEAAFGEAGSR